MLTLLNTSQRLSCKMLSINLVFLNQAAIIKITSSILKKNTILTSRLLVNNDLLTLKIININFLLLQLNAHTS